MEFDGLVGVGGKWGAGGHYSDASANVAGQRFDVFQGGEFDFLHRGGDGQFLKVEFGVSGDDGEEV